MRCGLDTVLLNSPLTRIWTTFFVLKEIIPSHSCFPACFPPLTFCNLHKFVCNICHCTLVEKHVLCNNNRHNLNFVTCIYDIKNLQNLHFQFVNNLLNSMQELKSSLLNGLIRVTLIYRAIYIWIGRYNTGHYILNTYLHHYWFANWPLASRKEADHTNRQGHLRQID